MKKIFQTAVCTLLAFGVSVAVMAQEEKVKEKGEKDAKASKNKLKEFDEIIVRKVGDKDAKVVIEIKGDDVLVNGKPLSDYDDDNVIVRKNNVSIWNGNARALTTVGSPFRQNVIGGFNNTAFLGVTTEKDDKGARITDITEKSAAAKSGLKEGDVIVKIDDTKVEDQDDLSKAITKHKPEEKVTVTYLRDGKQATTSATLGKHSFSYNGTYTMPSIAAPEFHFDMGERMEPLTAYGFYRPRIGIRAQDTEDGKGVKVIDVSDESLADKGGIKEGDIITEFDGKTVNDADALADAARDAKEKTTINVKFTRDGKSQSVDLKVPKKLKTANL